MGKSLPMNIPDWSKIMRDCDHVIRYDDDDDNEDDWLPPHEYLARVRSASFSVHEGVGRTLKGRDLSRLRNAIWKQTGFEQD
ncbi:putative senescence regulator S40 [Tanacetum coccineum]